MQHEKRKPQLVVGLKDTEKKVLVKKSKERRKRGRDLMAIISDVKRKMIIADRVNGDSIRSIAKKHNVSTTSVQRIIKEDSTFTQIVTQKKEENAADILAYMESQKGLVCEIIGKGLAELAKAEKLEGATMSQITTALGTLIDKWTLVNGAQADEAKEDGLSRSLREMAEELESD